MSRIDFSKSDSGVHVLDPEDQALFRACLEAYGNEETDAEAHRRWLKIARELPSVRLEKVMRIRKLIADGSYVTEGRLRATVDKLLENLH